MQAGDTVESVRPDVDIGDHTIVHIMVPAEGTSPARAMLRRPSDPRGQDLLVMAEQEIVVVA